MKMIGIILHYIYLDNMLLYIIMLSSNYIACFFGNVEQTNFTLRRTLLYKVVISWISSDIVFIEH